MISLSAVAKGSAAGNERPLAASCGRQQGAEGSQSGLKGRHFVGPRLTQLQASLLPWYRHPVMYGIGQYNAGQGERHWLGPIPGG